MNSIDDKKKKKTYGVENPENIFTAIDETTDSYWEDKTKSAEIMEYGFCTPAEMTELLRGFIEDEKLCRMIAAASFKRIHSYSQKEKKEAKANEGQQLPEFVYVF